MNLQDCDYILDKKDRLYIVKKGGKKILCNLVFIPSKNGDRFNHLLKKNYHKYIEDKPANSFLINRKDVKRVFKPKKCFKEKYRNLPEQWKKIADAILSCGVKKKDMGIFGSNLIGFDIVKDVDFVVYGKDNCIKIMKNMNSVRKFTGAGKISKEHIRYQDKKFKKGLSKENDFKNMFKNKWSSLQISKNVLTTIRFAYHSDEEPKDIEMKRGHETIFEGRVIWDFGSNFVPRVFYVKLADGSEIRVLTYFWAYQSCVKKGQKIRFFGEFRNENKTLYISKTRHWIKILKDN